MTPEVHCHASDADAAGNQQSCPSMAWTLIPWQSANGQSFRVPLCFKHMLVYVRREQPGKSVPVRDGETRTALQHLADSPDGMLRIFAHLVALDQAGIGKPELLELFLQTFAESRGDR